MKINSDTIRLDQFLKWAGLVSTGAQAKLLIQNGDVRVNGSLESRRGRKLGPGDQVTLGEQSVFIERDQALPASESDN